MRLSIARATLARATLARATLALAICGVLLVPSAAFAADGTATRWIVQLKPDASVTQAVTRARDRLGVVATHRFSRVLNGFGANLTASQRTALLADPNVAAVVPDAPIAAAAQPGIARVGALDNDDRELGPPLDVDIAVLDTGIQPNNAALNIAGGYNCTDPSQSESQRQQPGSWADSAWFGHGTHVAGIAAAREPSPQAGVAQGARLWAIKVLDGSGNGYWSWVICGLERVVAMGAQIEVVNMSIAGAGWDDGNCGRDNADLLHQAICLVDDAGITMVAAAGNSAGNAANYVPGAYDEVITVSAMADWNGAPLGNGSRPPNCTKTEADDQFAGFSNFGPDIDLIAPGVCVLSLLPIDTTGLMSGTSMATPHVAGGAALYFLAEKRLGRPRPTPAQVRAALIAAGTSDWRTNTDPDGIHEPALFVGSFGAVASGFELSTSPHLVRVAPGGSATVDVAIARLSGHSHSVDLSVDANTLPPGAGATFNSDPVPGAGTTSTLTINVPGSAAPATYDVDIRSNDGSHTEHAILRLVVFDTTADSGSPSLKLRNKIEAPLVEFAVRVAWPKVSGASKYEVHESIDGGAWMLLGKVSGTKLDTAIWPGQRTQFRVRAKVGASWQAWRTGLSAVGVPHEPVGEIELSGNWLEASIPRAYSEIPLYSTQAGATATLEFNGRSVAWLGTKANNRGRARVWIDGRVAATVDLYSAAQKHRRVVFSQSWASVGEHVLVIEVLGSPSGRPRVDLDALLVVTE